MCVSVSLCRLLNVYACTYECLWVSVHRETISRSAHTIWRMSFVLVLLLSLRVVVITFHLHHTYTNTCSHKIHFVYASNIHKVIHRLPLTHVTRIYILWFNSILGDARVFDYTCLYVLESRRVCVCVCLWVWVLNVHASLLRFQFEAHIIVSFSLFRSSVNICSTHIFVRYATNRRIPKS